MKPRRLLLAGSHAGATATAVVKEIRKRRLPWEIFWVGKKWATEERNSTTLEYNSLPRLGVKFFPIESGKVQTKLTRYTIPALLMIPFGFIMAGFYLMRIRPDLVLSFGGAAGAEVSFWAWIFGIPVIIHEQTSTAGRANIFSSRFARTIAVARDSSKKFFDKKNIVVTGNPINSEMKAKRAKEKPETLFITGGSRGSEWINRAVEPILKDLLKKYKVTLQVGEGNLSRFKIRDSGLRLYGQISPEEWVKIMSGADMVISRAGANVVSELIALKKPCILIPIPWSYLDEQNKNAVYARDFGIARILPQAELSPESLLKEIKLLGGNYLEIIHKVENKTSPDFEASGKLVDLLLKYA